MLNRFLKEMDNYLANRPFKRSWFSRPLAAHIVMDPPLSKEYPLWKRNCNELMLFRLFNLSPAELKQKIDHYWQQPRWRRWVSAWNMKKKIDVWNYYQRCLAYRAARSDILASVTHSSERLLLFSGLGSELYHFTKKFETFVEKRCRNPQWIEKHYAKEIKKFQQQVKKNFYKTLNNFLKKTPHYEHKLTLKQQAHQEFLQLETFILRYYYQSMPDFVSRLAQTHVAKGNRDSVTPQNQPNLDCHLSVYHKSAESFTQQVFLSSDHQEQIHSLHNFQEWLNEQRQKLKQFIEEGSLNHVEVLLQSSLNVIKKITELHLVDFERMLSYIQDQPQTYDFFLKYFDTLQSKLKSLLQSGVLLFHPDHIQHLRPSPAIWNLIGYFSQLYLEQNRYYLAKFKTYNQPTGISYCRSDWQLGYSKFRVQLGYLEKELKKVQQSFAGLNHKLNAFNDRCAKDRVEIEAQRERDKAELQLNLDAMEAQRQRDKTEIEAVQKIDKAEIEALRVRDKAEIEDQINKLSKHFIEKASLTHMQPKQNRLLSCNF